MREKTLIRLRDLLTATLALLGIATVLFMLTGCTGLKPHQVAPAIQVVAAAIVLFTPDACEEVPFDDIQTAIDATQAAKDDLELVCGGASVDDSGTADEATD